MNKELQFPIVYDLRIIFNGDSQEGIIKITKLLDDLSISSRPGIVKPGGKSALVRLGFNITLLNKEQMDTLYKNLQSMPGIKWAT